MNIAPFIKQLQKAHSGEIGAYFAYGGHWKSVKDPSKKLWIQWIQKEELEHIHSLELMLYLLRSRPDRFRDKIFAKIGKTLGFLCFLTGYRLPMWGAAVIEKVGAVNYEEMSKMASQMQMHEFAQTLGEMHLVEKEHEEWFRTCLKPKVGSGR